MKNKTGAKYVFCSGANKAAPKGKNTANKKKKNIPKGMAKKSIKIGDKVKIKPGKKKFTLKKGPGNKNKLVPMRAKMNQTISNRPIMSLRRSGGGY